MELVTNTKTTNLRFSTRKLVRISKILNGKNFENLYFKALNENDVESLAQILMVFCENEDGTASFKNVEEVYDFIDDYMAENKKNYIDIFEELAVAINEEGFFLRKMSEEILKDRITNPLSSLDMNELIKNSTEKAVSKVAEKEFQGYMG